MTEKPDATHIALECLLLYSHNHTSEWLQSKSVEEKLFKVARELSSIQESKFLKWRDEIIEKRQKESKGRIKETLTKQIQKVNQ